MFVNGQNIDYSSFNTKQMNKAMTNTLNENKHRSRVHYSNKAKKVYNYIKENNENIFVDSLITTINLEILTDYVALINTVSVASIKCIPCEKFTTYQELAKRCNDDWNVNRDDKFFKDKWGKKILVISYFNERTSMVYVICAIKN